MEPTSRLNVIDTVRTVIKDTYVFTRTLPREEQFGLSSQMRRAAVSIGLNIVEGSSRQSTRELLRYLEIARGSGKELDFAFVVSEDLELGRELFRATAREHLEVAQKQLSALIRSLRKRMRDGTRK